MTLYTDHSYMHTKDIKLINTALSDSPDFRSDKENPAGKSKPSDVNRVY